MAKVLVNQVGLHLKSSRNSVFLRPKVILQYFSQSSSQERIKLSEACIKRLQDITNDNFLRITVEGGGCSGFQYKFALDSTINDDDMIIEKAGAKVVIDETSLDYIDGSTLDYETELIRSSFVIANNPKAESGCSCGASFAVKLD